MDDITRIERKRGRPSNASRTEGLPEYSGPSLDTCLGMSDAEVTEAFNALQLEPSRFLWRDDDDLFNYALYNTDHPNEPNMKPSVELMATLKARAVVSFERATRCQLFAAMLLEWVKTLKHSDLLRMLKVRGVEASETKIRYVALSDFQRQLTNLLYAEAVQGSEKYPKSGTEQPSFKGRRKTQTMK